MPKQRGGDTRKQRGGGDTRKQVKSYKLPKHINTTIQEGDTVLLRSSEPGIVSYVARVESIETKDGSSQVIGVRVRWYYRPEETIRGRRKFHGAKEVFLSDHYDDFQSVDTIQGKCKVHSFDDYVNLHSVGNEDFFCRFEYNSATGAFNPDSVPVFCKCKMPYNPDDFMVQCEDCSRWLWRFHPCCMGTTVEEAKKLDHYYCQECCFKCCCCN